MGDIVLHPSRTATAGWAVGGFPGDFRANRDQPITQSVVAYGRQLHEYWGALNIRKGSWYQTWLG